MKRDNLFWGTILLIVGSILLLDNLGIFNFLEISVWQLIWPTVVILLGVWMLWGATRGKAHLDIEELALPLEGAAQAHVKIDYGAGRIRLDGKAPPTHLLMGTFEGGVEHNLNTDKDNAMKLKLKTPAQVYAPWNWGYNTRDWNLSLTPDIPITLRIQIGASDTHLDLTELQITKLAVNTGASSTHVMLPAHIAYTHATFEGGATSLNIQVPEGVAAHIHTEGAIYDAKINQQRFPRQGNAYQSINYETAERKADIVIKMGVGSAVVN